MLPYREDLLSCIYLMLVKKGNMGYLDIFV